MTTPITNKYCDQCECTADYVTAIQCRCCGGFAHYSDKYPIHTRCITKHWSKHAHGINASRCREFGKVK